eukprot:GHVP01067236.1.p1 GENE.GHVP01067236.1~~GHVP01067236.1.p1  ORF type:complete len:639 (-),score=115.76 GHVP01067236.1:316-2232(-)
MEDSIYEEMYRIMNIYEPGLIISRKLYNSTDPTDTHEELKYILEESLLMWALIKPNGYAMVKYKTKQFNDTTMHTLCFDLKVPTPIRKAYPEKGPIFLNPQYDSLESDVVVDLEFQLGVISALELESHPTDSEFIHFSKVIKNLDINLEKNEYYYNGVILGFGLKGAFKKAGMNFLYSLLKRQKKTLTCVLMISLGISSSIDDFSGISSVMKLHIPLFDSEITGIKGKVTKEIPRGEDFMISSIIGLSLLHFKSPEFSIGGKFIKEILEGKKKPKRHNSYYLSLGIGLGLVFFGNGREGLQKDIFESLELEEKLVNIVNSRILDKSSIKDEESLKNNITTIKTISGIVALGMIYCKSEKRYIADSLLSPISLSDYHKERPDINFYRTVAKGMIMWNEIIAEKSWVENHIPDFFSKTPFPEREKKLATDEEIVLIVLSNLSILRGMSCCLALKYAGQGNIAVRRFFRYASEYMEKIAMALDLFSRNDSIYSQMISCPMNNIPAYLNLCYSVCFSGSGDLDVFRRIRGFHNNNLFSTPGICLMESLSFGFLFLGEGKYTINTRTDKGLACLFVTLIPIFYNEMAEYERYPPYIRYLWNLAVHKREEGVDVKERKENEEAFFKSDLSYQIKKIRKSIGNII